MNKAKSIKHLLSPKEYEIWKKYRKSVSGKKYYVKHKEKIKDKVTNWSKEKRNKNKQKQYQKKYRNQHRELTNARNKKWRDEKVTADSNYAVKQILRSTVSYSIKRIASNKPTSTEKLLGCTWEEARIHLESLFPAGMNWSNHGRGPGTWQVDHIRPVASFSENDMHLMNHISNLQPIWWEEHIVKSAHENVLLRTNSNSSIKC